MSWVGELYRSVRMSVPFATRSLLRYQEVSASYYLTSTRTPLNPASHSLRCCSLAPVRDALTSIQWPLPLPVTMYALSWSTPASFIGKTRTQALSLSRTNCTVSSGGAKRKRACPASQLAHCAAVVFASAVGVSTDTVIPFLRPSNFAPG